MEVRLKMNSPTLYNILETFNAPLNEEQAWAVCHQCAKYLENDWNKNAPSCFKFNGVQSVEMGKDGVVQSVLATTGNDINNQIILSVPAQIIYFNNDRKPYSNVF